MPRCACSSVRRTRKYRRRNAAIWVDESRAQARRHQLKNLLPGATHDFDESRRQPAGRPANAAAMRDATAAAVAFFATALK